jgi:glycosyltransferase involved in cell wall biosynthesis
MARAKHAHAMKVIRINTADRGGGAERLAWVLFKGMQRRGMDSWLLVGDKKTDDDRVVPFWGSPFIDYRPYGRLWHRLRQDIRKWIDQRLGLEDFHHPFSKHIETITGSRPDVVHCHNLHGGYFDLRVLANVSRTYPVFITLHDAWWLTGHCAIPLDCTRWKHGCGRCPYLSIPPAVKRDATRFNWRRKQRINNRSRIYVAARTHWVLERARQSILSAAMVEGRVVTHGIDLGVYRPAADRAKVRAALNISPEVSLVVFVANLAKENPYKDYATMREALERLGANGQQPKRAIWFYCIGGSAADQYVGGVLIRHIPWTRPEELARYYQAADVYLHAGKGGTFGQAIAEAMACGTPVVTIRLGGVPDVCSDGVHGLLVAPGNAEEMAKALEQILNDHTLRARLGSQAAESAKVRFDQERMITEYAEWYAEVLQNHR